MSDGVKTAAVIGGGPAGLSAAEVLADAGVAVTVYDRMPSVGRKFLMAGRGGLNLTHSEPLPRFLARYEVLPDPLRVALDALPPDSLRRWSEDLGQPTFVGSSGRVFPTAMKASPLLRAWLRRLAGGGVSLRVRHRWTGWDTEGALSFATPDGPRTAQADVTVLALGGASWPQLGSDGEWAPVLARDALQVTPLTPSNCGVLVDWSELFRSRFEGEPIKNVALRFGQRTSRGDLVVTRTGLEGGALYALGAPVREAILASGEATLSLSLRPDLPMDAIAARLAVRPPGQSLSTFLRKALKLPPIAVALLREAVGPATPPSGADLATLINAVPIRLTGLAPIARAISTSGGLRFDELDSALMLLRRPGVFVAGEMLDWDAPTGGYLLQACIATGRRAGQGASDWLGRTEGQLP